MKKKELRRKSEGRYWKKIINKRKKEKGKGKGKESHQMS